MPGCYGIDIGTNSARLMRAERVNGNVLSRYKRLVTVRTGEGMDENGFLDTASVNRVLAALREFRTIIDAEAPSLPVFCFATSAVRDAKNADELAARILRETGFSLHILSGEDEAEVGFLGAVPSGTGGLIDIGGGSTEIVCGKNGSLDFRKSFQLGTVRCKEQFGMHPHPLAQTTEHSDALFSALGTLPHMRYTGIGGTITSVAAMLLGAEQYDPQKIQGSVISRADTEALLSQLSHMSLEQRRKVRGLQPQRADVILYGMTILLSAMRALDLSELTVSDADNLEGYAIKYHVGE